MDCNALEETIRSGFSEWTKVYTLKSGECLVRLPFWDGAGDPIELSVAVKDGCATIDDAGSVAGLLFSLGQNVEGTPGFRLLEHLRHAHGLELDFDQGLLKLSVAEDRLYDGVAEMTKVILALHTAVPHMPVSPRRERSFGPRLKSKIVRRYRDMKILDMVERSYLLDGATVSGWPVDFRWSIGSNGNRHAVNVVAADLAVAQPLEKAHKIAALSVDTQMQDRGRIDQLRVVFESQAENTQAEEATEFLRFHSKKLEYHVFDLGERTEFDDFFSTSLQEITRETPEEWAMFIASAHQP